MSRRIMAVAASVALSASLLAPSALGVAATHKAAPAVRTAGLHKAPADPYAKQDRKFKGQSITYYGGSVGTDNLADVQLVAAFKKSTGIKVHLNPMPSDSTAALSVLERDFSSGSSAIDATRMDVVWPGTIGKYLQPIPKKWGAPVTKLETKSLLVNDTVGGKLRAFPYQGDFGMLFYRKDLLKKYNHKVPTTWAQLGSEAASIQAGQRKTDSKFYGLAFQGKSYEGLTCNALEWLASSGGGTFITSTGKVTVNNTKAAAILTRIQGWVGKITPRDITSYDEGATASLFTSGEAAFARNWPYMDSLAILKGTKVQGKVGVAPLPHGSSGKSSATTGGWQVGVSKFSKHRGAALAWARYYASFRVQVWRATYAGIVPTMGSVNNVKSVKKAQPFLATVATHTSRVVRPATVLGGNYNQGSTDIFQAINSIETGSNVKSTLASLASELKALHP